jgi:hypothetical protein
MWQGERKKKKLSIYGIFTFYASTCILDEGSKQSNFSSGAMKNFFKVLTRLCISYPNKSTAYRTIYRTNHIIPPCTQMKQVYITWLPCQTGEIDTENNYIRKPQIVESTWVLLSSLSKTVRRTPDNKHHTCRGTGTFIRFVHIYTRIELHHTMSNLNM